MDQTYQDKRAAFQASLETLRGRHAVAESLAEAQRAVQEADLEVDRLFRELAIPLVARCRLVFELGEGGYPRRLRVSEGEAAVELRALLEALPTPTDPVRHPTHASDMCVLTQEGQGVLVMTSFFNDTSKAWELRAHWAGVSHSGSREDDLPRVEAADLSVKTLEALEELQGDAQDHLVFCLTELEEAKGRLARIEQLLAFCKARYKLGAPDEQA